MTEHARGPTYARRSIPRFEFKPGSADHSGGGYPRIRSTEYREHTSGEGADDVFVAVHRLLAVAWLLPDDMTAAEALQGEVLAGVDVHHELGLPAANVEDELALVEHSRHSEVTQAQVRAWAADARDVVASEGDATRGSDGRRDAMCARCGTESETRCTWDGFEGEVCPECAADVAPDAAIEVV